MRTSGVKSLVEDVLESISQPYSHHVIDDVFLAIEKNPKWQLEYDALCSQLGKDVVNNWGGRWVAIALGKVGEQQVPSKASSLIGSYSLLDTDAKTLAKKPTALEARKILSDYYHSHKSDLPVDIKKYRERILDLLTSGMPPENAFATAVEEQQ